MNDVLSVVGDTLVAEFSDLNDVGDMTVVMLRLLMAAFLGGVLGLEREQRGKPAGVRTHMLVCMGAALFVLVPDQSGISEQEMSRVVQGIISGIGFLGAGAILKGKDDQHASGLTTAAGIWLTAAIGVAVGVGREQTAVLCTLLAWLVLSVVPMFLHFLQKKSPK